MLGLLHRKEFAISPKKETREERLGKVAKLRSARLKARREITVGKGKIMASPRLAKDDTLLLPTTLRGWPRTSLRSDDVCDH